MVQKTCEICDDPMPLDSVGTICDSCDSSIRAIELDPEEEETQCKEEIAESVGVSSSSGTPTETTNEVKLDESMSQNTGVSSVARSILDDLDFSPPTQFSQTKIEPETKPEPTLETTSGNEEQAEARFEREPLTDEQRAELLTEAKEQEKREPCDGCGKLEKNLQTFKAPLAKDSLDLCAKCFADEVAIVNKKDDPMQGKLIHPDESEREEILSFDDEDKTLFNDEVLINASTPLEQVQQRIELLERRLHNVKLQLTAAKRTMNMRVENLEKGKRDEMYRQMQDRLDKRRAAKGNGKSAGGERKPRRTKAQQFRDVMKEQGFADAWIDEQIKKMGLSD